MTMFFKRFMSRIAKSLSTSKMLRDHQFTVTVEGNIGSGKTTFIERFDNKNNVEIISEPIEKWRDCGGHNLLALLYEDPKKWGFTFQTYIQLTMLQNHTRSTDKALKIMERSMYSARYCFVEKMVKDGLLTPPAFSVLDEWYKWICRTQDVSVDLIIYLRTSPEVVYDRMVKRNRSEEKTVSFEYIKGLHDLHENWLYHKTMFSLPAPVIVIDANPDLDSLQAEYQRCESQILEKCAVVA